LIVTASNSRKLIRIAMATNSSSDTNKTMD
jgi:hypothetical protein